jgi:hypothetical protein
MSELPERVPPTSSGSNNSLTTTTTTTLTPVTLNSIDSLTISFLKNEISFEQYESMIENQHFQNEPMLNQLNTEQMGRLLFTAENPQVGATIELNTYDALADNPFSFSGQENNSQVKPKANKKRAKSEINIDSNNESSQSSSPIKKPKLKDRFLNIKDIMNDKDMLDDDEFEKEIQVEDISDEDDDEEEEDEDEDDDDDDEDRIEDFDETSNWNDFDIETLNFDKFIKDHQVSNKPKSAGEASANSFPDQNAQFSRSNNLSNKRKNKDDKIVDQVELKAKRRVILEN